jgi:hypothetical protein
VYISSISERFFKFRPSFSSQTQEKVLGEVLGALSNRDKYSKTEIGLQELLVVLDGLLFALDL